MGAPLGITRTDHTSAELRGLFEAVPNGGVMLLPRDEIRKTSPGDVGRQ
jgi:hypothetical protein